MDCFVCIRYWNYFFESFGVEYVPEERKEKKCVKYTAAFDYIDKTSIVSSGTTAGISIISGIVSISFNLTFSLTTGIIKKLLKITRNKKKTHNKIAMLAKSKLNSIETLISQDINRSWH